MKNIHKLTFNDEEEEEQSQKLTNTHNLLSQLESKLSNYIRPIIVQSDQHQNQETVNQTQFRISTQQPINYSFKDPEIEYQTLLPTHQLYQGAQVQHSYRKYIQEQLELDAQIIYKEQKERLDLIIQKSKELINQEINKRSLLKSQINKISLDKIQLMDNIRSVKLQIQQNNQEKDQIQAEINILLRLNEELLQNNIKRQQSNMNSTPVKSNISITQPYQTQISQARITEISQPIIPQNSQPGQLEIFQQTSNQLQQNKDQVSNLYSKEIITQKNITLDKSESIQDLKAIHNRLLSQFSNLKLQENSQESKHNIQIIDDTEVNVEKNLFFQKSNKDMVNLEKGRQLSGILNQSNAFQSKSATKNDIQNDQHQYEDEQSKSKSQIIYSKPNKKSMTKRKVPKTHQSKGFLKDKEGLNLDFDNLLKQRFIQENIQTEEKDKVQKSFHKNKENSLIKRNRQVSLSVSGKNSSKQKVQIDQSKTKNSNKKTKNIIVADDFREIYDQHFRDKIQYLNQLVADTLNME